MEQAELLRAQIDREEAALPIVLDKVSATPSARTQSSGASGLSACLSRLRGAEDRFVRLADERFQRVANMGRLILLVVFLTVAAHACSPLCLPPVDG